MDVVLVIAVRTRAEHGAETGAGIFPQTLAKILGHSRVGQLDDCTVGELERADVERVGLAMLGEPRSDDPVAAAAIKGGIVVDAFERSPQRAHRRHHPPPHPITEALAKPAGAERGARHRPLLLSASRTASSRTTSSTTHSTGPARAGSDGATANSAVSRSRQAEGGGASSGVASCA